MSMEAPFSLSRTYDVRVEKAGFTLTRVSSHTRRRVWLATAIIIAFGTPAAVLVIGRYSGVIPMFVGFVMMLAGWARLSTESSSPALVLSPTTIHLRTATLPTSDEYRSAERRSHVMVVDGEAPRDEEPDAVLVLSLESRGSTSYTVTLVSGTRVVHVETTNDVMVANELAADLRECLGLRDSEPAVHAEPVIAARMVYALVGLFIEMLAIPGTMFLTAFAPKNAALAEHFVRATSAGVGVVALDVLIRRVVRPTEEDVLDYVRRVRALVEAPKQGDDVTP